MAMMASDDGVFIGLGLGFLSFALLWVIMWFATKGWQ
jgi:hypothetical protein